MLADATARARRAATFQNGLHLLLFVLSLSLAFGTFNGTLFGWHPFAMSIGYLFFMAEGLISAWAIRTTAGEERVRGLELHALMQVRPLANWRRYWTCVHVPADGSVELVTCRQPEASIYDGGGACLPQQLRGV